MKTSTLKKALRLSSLLIGLFISFYYNSSAQKAQFPNKDAMLKQISESGCLCVDSIITFDRTVGDVARDINECLKTQVGAYQLALKLANLDSLKATAEEKEGRKEINISISLDENSPEYREYYYEIERYMMGNCKSLKSKIAVSEKQREKSLSTNKEALKLYYEGIDESKKENHQKAAKKYEKAVEIDPEFAFAWDNLGLCYRKLEKYDEAIEAYKKSLAIDPYGTMPLQNIAIVYQYKKQFSDAIRTYEQLAMLDDKNPEVYYGIGVIYATNLNDFEKSLENIVRRIIYT